MKKDQLPLSDFFRNRGRRSASPQAQPVVPGFTHAVARREVALVELIAFQDLRENSGDGQIIGVENCVSGADGGGVMRIARGGHGQAANLRVLERITIVATQGRRGIKHFDRVHRECFEGGKTDAGAKKIVGMRRNGEAAAFMNHVANFARRFSFQIRKRRADAQEMTIRGRDFDSGNDEKIVDRFSILAHQPFLQR